MQFPKMPWDRILLAVVVGLTLGLSTHSEAAKAKTRKPAAEEPESGTQEEAKESALSRPKFQFQSGFGVHIYSLPGLILGGQFLFSVNRDRTAYMGPELSYSLHSPTNMMMGQLLFLKDFRVYGAPRLSVQAGGSAGVLISDGTGGLPATSYVVMGEMGLVQDVDDLVSVKGRFRPGLIAGAFSFIMSFEFLFRFY